jgi:hypothetical protein
LCASRFLDIFAFCRAPFQLWLCRRQRYQAPAKDIGKDIGTTRHNRDGVIWWKEVS